MCSTDRSAPTARWLATATLFVSFFLSIAATSAVAADATLERGESRATDHGNGEGLRFEADVPTKPQAHLLPRSKARFPDRALVLPGARAVTTSYRPDESRAAQALQSGHGSPTALATGDFDRDGVADLICGYTTTDGGLVTLHTGNIDAIFPRSPGARLRRQQGTFSEEPFLAHARVIESPVSPEFLAAGDFDGDDLWDVVVADDVRSGIFLLSGDGTGEFSPPVLIQLPGTVTALAAGEINRVDGLVDLVVGVSGPEGTAILVFEGPDGALRAEAEVVPVPAAPRALLLARLTDGPSHDLAVGAGDELLIIRGRDRRLVRGEDQRGDVRPPSVERVAVSAAVEALAWGDFAWEPDARRELALLLDDGTIRLLDRVGAKKTPHARSTSTASWTTIGRRELPTSGAGGTGPDSAQALLLPVRLTGNPTEDLAVFGAPDGRSLLLAGMVRNERDATPLADPGMSTVIDLARAPVAGLSMRLNADALSDLVLLLPGTTAPLVVPTAPQATITVDSTLDAAATDGACTLREAIENANADADTTGGDCVAGSGVDAISFNIAGGGSSATITPIAALPAITDSATLDGTTQGCASPPCILLDGTAAGSEVNGLVLSSGSSTVRGLAISAFSSNGVVAESPGNIVEGNFLGTDITGTTALGNAGFGALITSQNNQVGGTVTDARNVMSGNELDGVAMQGAGASQNVVLGNYIGTDVSGTLPLGNINDGVFVVDGSDNTMGGTTAGSRNVISSNVLVGVRIKGAPAIGNLVQGNYIGTDVTGTQDLGNAAHGLRIQDGATINTIGGTISGSRNIISGNELTGIRFNGRAQDNLLLGNYIGTDVTGSIDLGNGGSAVSIPDGANNTIGGTSLGARNVISGNEANGVYIAGETSSGNLVLGNFIGTDASGTVALGNGTTYPGVWISGGDNIIGGIEEGARNIISGNPSVGVYITNPTAHDNQVLGNYIGIDRTGSADLGNGGVGVQIGGGAQKNTIGGTSAEARNVISGNGSDGVYISGALSKDNEVLGNFIGTDARGTADLGNAYFGVEVDWGEGHTIGGTAAGAGNLISGNDLGGVLIELVATPNAVVGNLIGTDLTGTTALPNEQTGIWVAEASNVTIGGTSSDARNLISGNSGFGIALDSASDVLVVGNLIGTDITGMRDLGNTSHGVAIASSSNNTIGGEVAGARNIISGNDEDGIALYGATSSGNTVLGNFIGPDVTGTVDLGNEWNGIELLHGSNNTIGGNTAGARNIISGNDTYNGILIANATSNSVLGNFIGTDVSGTVAMGNGLAGVRIVDASDNTIGGASAGERNVISGNATLGVRIASSAAQNNDVLGNFIGTDVTGTAALGNLLAGVEIEDASHNTIGGTSPGDGNLISGNGDDQGWGVVIDAASHNEVLGNFIGTQVDGTSPLGNRLAGVGLANGSSNNSIGGTGVTPGRCDGPCNRIGFTTLPLNDGVRLLAGAGTGNRILGNSIHSNAELGIDLELSGITPNDPLDADTGANNQQNYPELTTAEATPAGLTVSGSLHSMPNLLYRLEFFGSRSCDDSGCGEGARYLGYHNVTTDGSGDASFSVAGLAGVSNSDTVTATATSIFFGTDPDTSEFSYCVTATCLAIATFGQSIVAPDPASMTWTSPDHVRYIKGPLAGVSSYAITETGDLPDATSLDIAADLPGEGTGFYYLVRPLACGSWQTAPAAEPGRDAALP